MKIMMTFLTFGKNIFGGIENSMYNLASGLIGNGHEVIVYTGKLGKDKNSINGIRVYYSNYLKDNFNEPIENIDSNIIRNYHENKLEIETELLSILEHEKPDYILSVDGLWGIISFMDIFQEIKCPTGLVYHMAYDADLIKRSLDSPFNHFFFVSEYLYKKISEMVDGFDKKEAYILPNSVRTEILKPREEKHAGEKEIIFCNSRLSTGKGIENLIEAFARVSKLRPRSELLLCGGDFHFGSNIKVIESVKNTSRRYGIEERIKFLPLLEWNDIPEYLHKANLVVLPTKDETFGIAALESLASGTPLIASRVGNLPDLVKDAGILLEYGDIDGLVKSIIRVLLDKELRVKMVSRGLKIADEYDHKVVARNFVKIMGGKHEE